MATFRDLFALWSVLVLLLCAGSTDDPNGQNKPLPGIEPVPGFDVASLPGFDRFLVLEDVDGLVGKLEHGAVESRRNAARSLGLIAGGTNIRNAVPALTKALEDKDAQVRMWSIAALREARKVGTVVESALPSVRERLFDEATDVRQQAAAFFMARPRDAAKAIQALERAMLTDKDNLVRVWSASAVANAKPSDKAAMEILRKGLNEKDSRVQQAIIFAFGDLRLSGLPILTDELRHGDADVRIMALSAMNWVISNPNNRARFPQDARDAVIASLKHDDKETVIKAIGVLSHLGDPPNDVMPTIIGFLKAPDPDVRYAAVSGLWQFGSAARVALPALTEALRDNDVGVRRAAKQIVDAFERIDANK